MNFDNFEDVPDLTPLLESHLSEGSRVKLGYLTSKHDRAVYIVGGIESGLLFGYSKHRPSSFGFRRCSITVAEDGVPKIESFYGEMLSIEDILRTSSDSIKDLIIFNIDLFRSLGSESST